MTGKHVANMTAAEYRAARAALVGGDVAAMAARADAVTMDRLRARHPDLAAAADAKASADHAGRVRALVVAEAAMKAAQAEHQAARSNPSSLIRDRAAAVLAEAVATHDALLEQVEAGGH